MAATTNVTVHVQMRGARVYRWLVRAVLASPLPDDWRVWLLNVGSRMVRVRVGLGRNGRGGTWERAPIKWSRTP